MGAKFWSTSLRLQHSISVIHEIPEINQTTCETRKKVKFGKDPYLEILLDCQIAENSRISKLFKIKIRKIEIHNFYYMLKNHQSFRNPIRYQFCKIPNPYFLSIKDPTSKTHPQPSPTTATGGWTGSNGYIWLSDLPLSHSLR